MDLVTRPMAADKCALHALVFLVDVGDNNTGIEACALYVESETHTSYAEAVAYGLYVVQAGVWVVHVCEFSF
jgi:hypothetical protein